MLRSGGGGSGESDPATRQGLLRRAAFARGCAAWRVAGTPPLPLPHRLLPPPPVSRRLFPRHCLVDWSGSSPIPCWDWEPRVPNPSEARGNEQAGRLCRASLRPVPSPCARSTATLVHAPRLIQSIPTSRRPLNQLVSAIRAHSALPSSGLFRSCGRCLVR
jgi:hypothetical protein